MQRSRLAELFCCLLLVVGTLVGLAPAAAASEGTTAPAPTCEELITYDYVCRAPGEAITFVFEQVREVLALTEQVVADVDAAVDQTYKFVSCTVVPEDPECQ